MSNSILRKKHFSKRVTSLKFYGEEKDLENGGEILALQILDDAYNYFGGEVSQKQVEAISNIKIKGNTISWDERGYICSFLSELCEHRELSNYINQLNENLKTQTGGRISMFKCSKTRDDLSVFGICMAFAVTLISFLNIGLEAGELSTYIWYASGISWFVGIALSAITFPLKHISPFYHWDLCQIATVKRNKHLNYFSIGKVLHATLFPIGAIFKYYELSVSAQSTEGFDLIILTSIIYWILFSGIPASLTGRLSKHHEGIVGAAFLAGQSCFVVTAWKVTGFLHPFVYTGLGLIALSWIGVYFYVKFIKERNLNYASIAERLMSYPIMAATLIWPLFL